MLFRSVGSATAPVQEVLRDGVNGSLVGFFDVPAWSAQLICALAEPDAFAGLRTAARQTVRDRYDLRSVCLPRMVDLVEGLGRQTAPDSGGLRGQ